MSKYSKNLSGQKLKVFVSNPIEYTDDTTFAAFVANAPEGELGVFDEAGTAITGALAAGDEFFIALKRDGFVDKTPIIAWNDLFRKKYNAYVAAVKKVQTIGYGSSSTSATFGFNFTGASSTNQQTYQISVRETTPGNQPFPVQEGYVVVRSSTTDQYTALATIVSQLNGDNDYDKAYPDRFVKAEIVSDGTVTYLTSTIDPTVTQYSTKITYSANVTVAAGAFLYIRGAVYKVATGVTAGTTLYIDRPYQGTTETIDVSVETTAFGNAVTYTSGTTKLGVKLTALEFDSHFTTSPFTGLVNDTVTTLTEWKQGVGVGTQVQDLEKEGIIFDGVGSTVNAAFMADYGYPTLFASSTKNYNMFFLEFAPTILPSAALPLYKQNQIERIVIAAPTDATTPSNELQTIFGL